MGMDVMGMNATSEKGEYFRNNVWWWRPLWDYCLNEHGDIAGQVEHGHSNDGDGLDGENSRTLGLRLLEDVKTGRAAEYKQTYDKALSELPRVSCDEDERERTRRGECHYSRSHTRVLQCVSRLRNAGSLRNELSI